MKRIRIFWMVVKRCGLDKAVIGFAILFLAGSLFIMWREPQIDSYTDAMWMLFVSCMTIGYGDYTVVTPVGRIIVVVATVYQLVLFALLTGVIIGNYQEVLNYRKKETVMEFIDKLEHLTELSPEELEELQEKVRNLKGEGRKNQK